MFVPVDGGSRQALDVVFELIFYRKPKSYVRYRLFKVVVEIDQSLTFRIDFPSYQRPSSVAGNKSRAFLAELKDVNRVFVRCNDIYEVFFEAVPYFQLPRFPAARQDCFFGVPG